MYVKENEWWKIPTKRKMKMGIFPSSHMMQLSAINIEFNGFSHMMYTFYSIYTYKGMNEWRILCGSEKDEDEN